MSVLKLFVRSFHPLGNFGVGGLGYHGDDRGFSHDPGDTARIYSIVKIDLQKALVVSEALDSDASSHFLGMNQDYSAPSTKPTYTLFGGSVDPYREDGDQGAQVALAYVGQNFAMPFGNSERARDAVYEHVVPGLDVMATLNIEIDRDDERISASFRMVGDGFPNAEAFLLDGSNNALMLASHRRVGSALHQLRGNRRIAMASTGIEVDFSLAGQFGSALDVSWCLDYATVTGSAIDVEEETGKNPTSRSAWNEMHTKRDAEGGWGRYILGDTLPTFVPGRSGSSMP